MDIGAKVWTLCLNSAVQGPTDENGCGEYLYSGEFVSLEDYEIALRRILELEQERESWKQLHNRMRDE